MKKPVSFFLALVMLCSLAACGSLNPKSSEGPSTKLGQIGDTMSTYWFDFTIESAYLCSQYDGYTAQEGCQLVVASITLLNTCGEPVSMWETDFPILWDDEENGIDIPLTVYSADQLPAEYSLGAGESRTGLLIYEVPKEYGDFIIWFQEVLENLDDPNDESGIEGDSFFVSFTPTEQ